MKEFRLEPSALEKISMSPDDLEKNSSFLVLNDHLVC